MNDRPDLRDLVADDVPEAERERLRAAHEALRSVPAPPEVPDSLTERILAIPRERSASRRRRLVGALALAAAIAGAAFGIGFWAGDSQDGLPVAEVLTLNATPSGPSGTRMVIEVLPVDRAGNWAMLGDVQGLPPLPEGGVYEVWMTKGTTLAARCGRFVVDEHGEARNVWLNAPYPLTEYDRWVVVAVMPGEPPSGWLLDGPVAAPPA